MLDRHADRTFLRLADDPLNQEGDLRAESWRVTWVTARQSAGRLVTRLRSAMRQLGPSLSRPHLTL
jgi:hypothetical protein